MKRIEKIADNTFLCVLYNAGAFGQPKHRDRFNKWSSEEQYQHASKAMIKWMDENEAITIAVDFHSRAFIEALYQSVNRGFAGKIWIPKIEWLDGSLTKINRTFYKGGSLPEMTEATERITIYITYDHYSYTTGNLLDDYYVLEKYKEWLNDPARYRHDAPKLPFSRRNPIIQIRPEASSEVGEHCGSSATGSSSNDYSHHISSAKIVNAAAERLELASSSVCIANSSENLSDASQPQRKSDDEKQESEGISIFDGGSLDAKGVVSAGGPEVSLGGEESKDNEVLGSGVEVGKKKGTAGEKRKVERMVAGEELDRDGNDLNEMEANPKREAGVGHRCREEWSSCLLGRHESPSSTRQNGAVGIFVVKSMPTMVAGSVV